MISQIKTLTVIILIVVVGIVIIKFEQMRKRISFFKRKETLL